MRIAHVRERNAPAGMPWRIAAALDPGDHPVRWLDLEVARQRAVRANPGLTHNAHLFRSPLTTLDDHLARGLRVEALRELVEGFEARADDDAAVAGFVQHPANDRVVEIHDVHLPTRESADVR